MKRWISAALVTAAPTAAPGCAADPQATVSHHADLAAANNRHSLTAAATGNQRAKVGNPLDVELQGRVNSWPLDESLIDYVGDSSAAALGLSLIAAEAPDSIAPSTARIE